MDESWTRLTVPGTVPVGVKTAALVGLVLVDAGLFEGTVVSSVPSVPFGGELGLVEGAGSRLGRFGM